MSPVDVQDEESTFATTGKERMEEMECPLCRQPIRSDAAVRRVCALCGMGIPRTLHVLSVEAEEGVLFFCSIRCLLESPTVERMRRQGRVRGSGQSTPGPP